MTCNYVVILLIIIIFGCYGMIILYISILVYSKYARTAHTPLPYSIRDHYQRYDPRPLMVALPTMSAPYGCLDDHGSLRELMYTIVQSAVSCITLSYMLIMLASCDVWNAAYSSVKDFMDSWLFSVPFPCLYNSCKLLYIGYLKWHNSLHRYANV